MKKLRRLEGRSSEGGALGTIAELDHGGEINEMIRGGLFLNATAIVMARARRRYGDS